MLFFHIIAGALALGAAGVALYVVKGSLLHRRSGLVFVGAMLVLAGSGALMAVFVTPDGVNVLNGLLTFYFVATALLTVRPPPEGQREVQSALMVAAFLLGAFAIGLGFEALGKPGHAASGIPAVLLFLFGAAAVVAGLLDVRLLRAGAVAGVQRLVRHAWRMGFALFIATTAFFLGQSQVFPEPVRDSGVLYLPVLVASLVPVWWVARLALKGERAIAQP
jgi:uncharacterized membrane protein